jgi:hypothetical protein
MHNAHKWKYDERAICVNFSYLLQMWHTGKEGAWQASLEDPRTGERVGLGSLKALWVFLQKRARVSNEGNFEV